MNDDDLIAKSWAAAARGMAEFFDELAAELKRRGPFGEPHRVPVTKRNIARSALRDLAFLGACERDRSRGAPNPPPSA